METIFEKIVKWNQERNLIKQGFNHQKEVSFIIEELLESTGEYTSGTARAKSEELTKTFFKENDNDEELLDAFADIIVFATGAIRKLGYNPDKVMEETFKEIDSRKSKAGVINGKFEKDISVEQYQANFLACKIN